MLITLKDGSREFENGMNALDIAGQLSQELKKQALAARVDGELVELVKPIDHDCTLEILTFEDDEWYDEDALYQTLDDTEVKPVKFRMIPYFAWDNRGMGEMIIWLPAFWGKY